MPCRHLPFHPAESWTSFLFAAWIVSTVVFTLLRAGSAEGLTLPAALLFWAAHIGLALILLQAVQMAVETARRPGSPWLRVAAAGLIGALAFMPVALLLDFALPEGAVASDAAEMGPALWLGKLAGQRPLVSLVWLGLNGTRLLRLPPVAPDSTDADDAAPTGLGRLLTAEQRGAIHSLSAELHDTRVHGPWDVALVLHPFTQAAEEMADGLKVHRSH